MSVSANTFEHNTPVSRRAGLRVHLWALAGYFVLALVVTYPTIVHFTTQVPGELIPDRDQHYWNFWWITQAAIRHTNPLQTDMLYYPYGVPLYYHVLAIPLWLIGLVPQLIMGYAAAYNTVVFAAFTLSGYGAFRLALMITGRPLPSFLGGVVFAFTPYTLGAVSDGQNEVFSLQWIPFFVESWLRAWQAPNWRSRAIPLILGGVFFAAGAYTTLYYPVDSLIFVGVFVVYRLMARGWQRARNQGAALASRLSSPLWLALLSLIVIGAVALVIGAPLIQGLVANYNNPRFDIQAGQAQMIAHSADLLGLFAPPHDHPAFGGTLYGTSKLAVRDNFGLGYAALALAVSGAIVAWRKRGTRFWVVFGIVGALLAMGPQLQIGPWQTGIPLPFSLAQNLPGAEAIGKVERFIALTRLSMAVLAAWGSAWILDRLFQAKVQGPRSKVQGPRSKVQGPRSKVQGPKSKIVFAAILSLLLVELPLHPRYSQPFYIPAGFTMLAQQPKGGLLELPFATQQVDVIGERMIYQTVHGQPIMAGYLSRNYKSPLIDACSPFWGFISARFVPIEGRDIYTPTLASRPLDPLNFYGIKYLALYSTYGGPNDSPLNPDDMSAYQDILAHVSHAPPLYKDNYVGIYFIDSTNLQDAPASFNIGSGWYKPEAQAQGASPFRWMQENEATLCLFAPRATTASLVMDGTAYARPRDIQVSIGSSTVFSGTLPEGVFSTIRTAQLVWPVGMTEIRITTPQQGVAPSSLDPANKDDRSLTVGFKSVRLETRSQK